MGLESPRPIDFCSSICYFLFFLLFIVLHENRKTIYIYINMYPTKKNIYIYIYVFRLLNIPLGSPGFAGGPQGIPGGPRGPRG